MPYGGTYTGGTATLDAVDETIVHGTGTLWLANATDLDTFTIDGNARGLVADVISDTELHLMAPWPGSNFTNAAYIIVQDSPGRHPQMATARAIMDVKESLRAFRYSKPLFGIKESFVDDPPIDYAVDEMLIVGDTPTGEFV